MYESAQKTECIASQFDMIASSELRKKAMAVCLALSVAALSGCSESEEQMQSVAISEQERNRNDSNFSITGLECNSDEMTVSVIARGATFIRLENRDDLDAGYTLMKSDDASIKTIVDADTNVSDVALVKGDLAQNIAIKVTDFNPNEVMRVLSGSEYGDSIDEIINPVATCNV